MFLSGANQKLLRFAVAAALIRGVESALLMEGVEPAPLTSLRGKRLGVVLGKEDVNTLIDVYVNFLNDEGKANPERQIVRKRIQVMARHHLNRWLSKGIKPQTEDNIKKKPQKRKRRDDYDGFSAEKLDTEEDSAKLAAYRRMLAEEASFATRRAYRMAVLASKKLANYELLHRADAERQARLQNLRERQVAKSRAWYENNRQHRLAYNANYRKRFKDKIRVYRRAYYLKHQLIERADVAAYYRINKLKISVYNQAYYLKHQSKIRAKQRALRLLRVEARRAALHAKFMDRERRRAELLGRVFNPYDPSYHVLTYKDIGETVFRILDIPVACLGGRTFRSALLDHEISAYIGVTSQVDVRNEALEWQRTILQAARISTKTRKPKPAR